MGQGLEVYDSSGNLIFGETAALGRVTNVVDIPASSSGSVTIVVPSEGTPFGMLIPTSGTFTPGGVPGRPTLGGSGTTLTYSNPSAIGYKYIIGVY